MTRKYVTLMIIPDGTESSQQWRMPQWLLRTLVIALGIIVIGIFLFFIFYGEMLSRAALTEKVQKDNEDLMRYRYKVLLLEENLKQAREIVERLTAMAGVDMEFPELPDDSTLFAAIENPEAATLSRGVGRDFSLPAGLPIDGFVTQQFVGEEDHYHPGLDIACAEGTPVLATGSGLIDYVGYDSLYGNLVVVRHNDSVTTMYGHNSEVLVMPGDQVMVGNRIALSGNTGTSTAPHLHYEIRIHDEPINPLENPYDHENEQP